MIKATDKECMRPRGLATVGGVTLLGLAVTTAMADGGPGGEHVAGLDEIVVTAQKRSENLQSVPISVSAVTAAVIENARANSLQGLQGVVPAVQINSFSNTPNTAVFTIRGIGVIDPDPYAGNTVSIVVDGVPQYFSFGALLDLYDIERVEVLRGPQGTLFGANTTGGVVNVITRQPTGELGGRAELSYGNYDRVDVNGSLDFPVGDRVSGKLAVSHSERDGYVTNVANGKDMGAKDVTMFRGYLKATPSDEVDFTLSGEYVMARNGSPVVVNGAVPGEALYVPAGVYPGASLPMYASPCEPAGRACKAPRHYYSANDSTRDVSDMDTYRGNLVVNVRNTAVGDITSITAYKYFSLFEETDQDGSPLFLIDTRRTTTGWQFSEELRTSWDLNDRVNLIAGGAYMKTRYDHLHRFRIQAFAPGVHQTNPQEQDNWSGSLFAHSYVKLSDRLKLQAGLRYTHEKTEMLAGSELLFDPSGVAQFEGGIHVTGFEVAGSKSWDKVGWKVGLDYQATDEALLYAYYARGFKSGGFTGRVGIPADVGPFDPEEVDTVEAGIKADWFDNRLRTNAAVFYTSYRDMQLAQIYFSSDANGNPVQGNTILNAAKAEIKGLELEVTALPAEGLEINASLAYLDATYEKFDFLEVSVLGTTIRDMSGARLQNAPKWAGSAGLRYQVPVSTGTATANLSYTYTGSKFLTSLVDAERSRIRAVSFVHASLEWKPASGAWSVTAWCRNLFDKRSVQATFDAPGTFANLGYTPPREYGVSLKYFW